MVADVRSSWMRIPRLLLGLLGLVFLGGCSAGSIQNVIVLAPDDQPLPTLVWPVPPEIPRFRYIGALLGEQNVRTIGGAGAAPGGGFWRWLTGVEQLPRQPLVLQRPQGGVIDAEGRIFIADVSRQAVFVFDVPTGQLAVWEFADDQRRFVAPVGVAVDHRGEILVSDAELKAVFRFDAKGQFLGQFGNGLLRRPTGIAVDSERRTTYVADTDASDIKVFNHDGSLLDTVGHLGNARGQLNRPVYLAFAQGRLYVSDTLNSRVQVFDREGNVIQVIGQRGMYVGNLTRPKGVAVDDEGHVYVVEGFYDHLLVFDRQGRFLMAMGGTGFKPGQFYLPTSVWTDASNRVYIADMFNGRVSVFQFLGEEQ